MRKKQRSRADRPPQAPTYPQAHIRRAPHRIRQGHNSGTQRARPHFSSLHLTVSGSARATAASVAAMVTATGTGRRNQSSPHFPPPGQVPAATVRARATAARQRCRRKETGRRRQSQRVQGAVDRGDGGGRASGRRGKRGGGPWTVRAPARGVWERPDERRAGGRPCAGQEGGRVAIYRHAPPSSTPPSPSAGGGGGAGGERREPSTSPPVASSAAAMAHAPQRPPGQDP